MTIEQEPLGPMPRALEFITVTTGGTAMSSRAEVADEVLARIGRPRLGHRNLWAGFSIDIAALTSGAAVFRLNYQRSQLSNNSIVWRASHSDDIWELLTSHAPDQVVLHRPRGVPWLATVLLPDAVTVGMRDPEVLLIMADAERCVAWAILEAQPWEGR